MLFATVACAAALTFSPMAAVSTPRATPARISAEPTMMALGAAQSRRAALLAVASLPILAANAEDDALAAIVAKNKAAAEAARSDEALAKKAKEEEDGANVQLIAGGAIGALVLASSALSFSASGSA